MGPEDWKIKTCDVCRILDSDTTRKECFYCLTCDAWICKKDQYRWDRRARAMVKKELGE